VERHICQNGLQPVMFDSDGKPFDLGREQRLYSRRQRRAMAARDGGCRFLDCERPPSWCEAHHIDHWVRDHGETNVDAGILLCKHHHLLLHDNGWEIHRVRGEFSLIPPPDVDPIQRPILMPSKSAAHGDWRLRRAERGRAERGVRQRRLRAAAALGQRRAEERVRAGR
jgi:hypothetical protein